MHVGPAGEWLFTLVARTVKHSRVASVRAATDGERLLEELRLGLSKSGFLGGYRLNRARRQCTPFLAGSISAKSLERAAVPHNSSRLSTMKLS
jgi:hypothetical protein